MKKFSAIILAIMLVGGCVSTVQEEEVGVVDPNQLSYDSEYDRFLDNVVIKRKSPSFVTYEYKDVRVDEIAPLASKYCQENGGKTAVLRNISLYKNFARWATFDCVTLQ